MSLEQKLRTLIREQLISEISRRTAARKLRIFDFDDTLVKTRSFIHVTTEDGRVFDLTPGEYAVYEKQPGDVMDYSDFEGLIDPQEIAWTVRILRNIVKAGSEAVILTARGESQPVAEFLSSARIPRIPIIALGNSDPQAKADYVRRRIREDGIDYVEFFDDSHKNVKAVSSVQNEFPPGTVQIVSRHIVHSPSL